ncbi:MAG: DUF4389 domain-containing protein [Ghiorsea sp.]
MTEKVKAGDIKTNVTDSSVWKRLLFMLLFTVLYSAAEVVLAVVVIYQFLSLLITGNKNAKVLSFGAQISKYAYQIFGYLTFNSEEQPFPIGDWPNDKPLAEKAAEPSKSKRAPRKPAAKKTVAKKVTPKAASGSAPVASDTQTKEEKPTEDPLAKG